jgi:hypothetical protein
MKGHIESVVVELNIEQRSDGTAFYVMQTPTVLWNALPQRAKRLDDDDPLLVHFMKELTFSARGRSYKFTFYRSERRPG